MLCHQHKHRLIIVVWGREDIFEHSLFHSTSQCFSCKDVPAKDINWFVWLVLSCASVLHRWYVIKLAACQLAMSVMVRKGYCGATTVSWVFPTRWTATSEQQLWLYSMSLYLIPWLLSHWTLTAPSLNSLAKKWKTTVAKMYWHFLHLHWLSWTQLQHAYQENFLVLFSVSRLDQLVNSIHLCMHDNLSQRKWSGRKYTPWLSCS